VTANAPGSRSMVRHPSGLVDIGVVADSCGLRRGPWGEHEKFDFRHHVRGEPGKYRECDGAGLSVAPHHDSRAVRGGRVDGYDRARTIADGRVARAAPDGYTA
jgi:hypothetical protein